MKLKFVGICLLFFVVIIGVTPYETGYSKIETCLPCENWVEQEIIPCLKACSLSYDTCLNTNRIGYGVPDKKRTRCKEGDNYCDLKSIMDNVGICPEDDMECVLCVSKKYLAHDIKGADQCVAKYTQDYMPPENQNDDAKKRRTDDTNDHANQLDDANKRRPDDTNGHANQHDDANKGRPDDTKSRENQENVPVAHREVYVDNSVDIKVIHEDKERHDYDTKGHVHTDDSAKSRPDLDDDDLTYRKGHQVDDVKEHREVEPEVIRVQAPIIPKDNQDAEANKRRVVTTEPKKGHPDTNHRRQDAEANARRKAEHGATKTRNNRNDDYVVDTKGRGYDNTFDDYLNGRYEDHGVHYIQHGDHIDRVVISTDHMHEDLLDNDSEGHGSHEVPHNDHIDHVQIDHGYGYDDRHNFGGYDYHNHGERDSYHTKYDVHHGEGDMHHTGHYEDQYDDHEDVVTLQLDRDHHQDDRGYENLGHGRRNGNSRFNTRNHAKGNEHLGRNGNSRLNTHYDYEDDDDAFHVDDVYLTVQGIDLNYSWDDLYGDDKKQDSGNNRAGTRNGGHGNNRKGGTDDYAIVVEQPEVEYFDELDFYFCFQDEFTRIAGQLLKLIDEIEGEETHNHAH